MDVDQLGKGLSDLMKQFLANSPTPMADTALADDLTEWMAAHPFESSVALPKILAAISELSGALFKITSAYGMLGIPIDLTNRPETAFEKKLFGQEDEKP